MVDLNKFKVIDFNKYYIKDLKGYMSSYFNNVFYVDTLKDYQDFIFNLLNDYKEEMGNDIKTLEEKTYRKYEYYIFRGLSNEEELKPGLFRDENETIKEYEGILINAFEKFSGSICGEYNNPLDLVSCATHYGIKTRLLDFSYSPYIATLFSLFKELDEGCYGLIFENTKDILILSNLPYDSNIHSSMTTKYLNIIDKYKELLESFNFLDKEEHMLNDLLNLDDEEFQCIIDEDSFLSDEQEKELEKFKYDYDDIKLVYNYAKDIVDNSQVFEKEYWLNQGSPAELLKCLIEYKDKIFIDTNFSNERIKSQKGLFEFKINEGISKYNNILLINPNIRNEILEYLAKLGISYFTLMPDLINVSSTINKMIKENIKIS